MEQHPPSDSPPAYGNPRPRSANVSHTEIERAALDIFATGERPSVATVRERLGRGSAATIADGLSRFWRDLGRRAEGDPAALARLPVEIVETVDTLWQRALALAAQVATHDDNAARERLAQIQLENDLRSQSLALREKEYDTAARERERALTETREQLRALLGMLERERATVRAKDRRIADLVKQLEDARGHRIEPVRQRVTHRIPRSGTSVRRSAATARRLRGNRPVKPPVRAVPRPARAAKPARSRATRKGR